MLFRILRTCCSLFQRNYNNKENLSLNFLFKLFNLHQISNIFFKKKIVIANAFPKLQSVEDLVRPLSKKRRFRTSFDSHHVKGSQTLVKSPWRPFYHIFPSVSREMVSKISLFLKLEIIGVFVNTLTADYKYTSPDCKNLHFNIQMQLS